MPLRRFLVRPSRVAEAALWSGAFAGAGLAVIGWRAPATPPTAARAVRPNDRRPPVATPAADAVASAADTLAAHDPFRLTHRPALVAYGAPEGPPRPWTPAAVATPVRPRLAVQGFVGGRSDWAAVLGGVPGRNGGVLVRAGDTLAGLRVRHIGRDTLVVAGADTVWRLTRDGTGGTGAAGTRAVAAGPYSPPNGARP